MVDEPGTNIFVDQPGTLTHFVDRRTHLIMCFSVRRWPLRPRAAPAPCAAGRFGPALLRAPLAADDQSRPQCRFPAYILYFKPISLREKPPEKKLVQSSHSRRNPALPGPIYQTRRFPGRSTKCVNFPGLISTNICFRVPHPGADLPNTYFPRFWEACLR